MKSARDRRGGGVFLRGILLRGGAAGGAGRGRQEKAG